MFSFLISFLRDISQQESVHLLDGQNPFQIPSKLNLEKDFCLSFTQYLKNLDRFSSSMLFNVTHFKKVAFISKKLQEFFKKAIVMFKPLVDYFLQIYCITARVSKQPGESVTLYMKKERPLKIRRVFQ